MWFGIFLNTGHPEFDFEISVAMGRPILGKKAKYESQTGVDNHIYATRAILKFFRGDAAEEEVSEIKASLI